MAERGPTQTYPPRITEFARRLYADGEGRTINEIRAALAKRGYHPGRDTVLYWVDEDFREALLMGQRHRRRRGGPHRPPRRKAWHRRWERMEELRNLGLCYRSIAALMSHDFEDLDLSADQVRYMLKGDVDARTMRRNLWPQGAKA